MNSAYPIKHAKHMRRKYSAWTKHRRL